MKKILGLLLISLLIGCTSQAYTEEMENVDKLLEDQNFKEANNTLKKAISERETDEALALQNVLESLLFAIDTEKEKGIEQALVFYEDIQNANNQYNLKSISLLKSYGNSKHKEIIQWIEEEKRIKESIMKAESLAGEYKFEESLKILGDLKGESEQHPNKDTLISSVDTSINDILAQESKYKEKQAIIEKKKAEEKRLAEEEAQRKAEEQELQKAEEEKKKEAAATEQISSYNLTKEQARNNVVEYAQVPIDNPNVFVEYSNDNEHGDWVFQVYELVIDDPETKEGHTATWGWYAVDPSTGYIYNNMNY